jgi:hypothetical protein
MITVEDFKSVPLNEMVLLTSKVSFIKILENENELHFRTYLQAGGKWYYSHDCNEYTTVLKGHLIEVLDNRKTYIEGETVV